MVVSSGLVGRRDSSSAGAETEVGSDTGAGRRCNVSGITKRIKEPAMRTPSPTKVGSQSE